jgi:hypothetical protein
MFSSARKGSGAQHFPEKPDSTKKGEYKNAKSSNLNKEVDVRIANPSSDLSHSFGGSSCGYRVQDPQVGGT